MTATSIVASSSLKVCEAAEQKGQASAARAGPTVATRARLSVANQVLVYRCMIATPTIVLGGWEDPRLDRAALEIRPSDNVLVITSAGCNALDYALCEPQHVYAVDMNPRQNALLDLKIAGIKTLDFEDFFRLFGYGFHPEARRLYQRRMRPELPAWSQAWWDKWIKFFNNPTRTFYYRGASGAFARLIKIYLDRMIRVRPHIDAILEAKTVAEQREIYERHLREKFWSRSMRFAMNRDTTLSMV